jgi:hypothetical protein
MTRARLTLRSNHLTCHGQWWRDDQQKGRCRVGRPRVFAHRRTATSPPGGSDVPSPEFRALQAPSRRRLSGSSSLTLN